MRTVPEALAAHLSGAATTLALCWKLIRRDGVSMGFTDHDQTININRMPYQAATGLTAGEAETALGLTAGSQAVEGALSSLAIKEADILAGRYDGARIEVYLVNWQTPAQRLLLDVAELGEVTRGGIAFTAELRGIASRLDRQRGRLYRRRCDAVLGDARCGVDLAAAGRFADTALIRLSAGELTVGAISGDLARFAQGHLVWRSGAAAGLKTEVTAAQRGADGSIRLSLAGEARGAPVAGDLVRLFVGCDKSFATCKARFANGSRFRGFPHLPGNDATMGFAKQDGRHDGTPVVP